MALTPEQIAALRANIAALNSAIAKGVRSVTIGGQTVIYNTTESLIKARDDAQDQLTAALPRRTRRRQAALFQNGRGY
jgi:hypothetical protein